MNLHELSKLADDIEFPETEKKQIFENCMRLQNRKKKGGYRNNIIRYAVLAVVALFIIGWGIHSNMSVTVVYASGTQGAVKMEVGHTVILEKQETPMGEGYVLRLVLGKNQYYYSLTDETNVCPDNIFQKGNMMYWFPDGLRGGNFRDEDNSVIQLPSTEKSTLKINVYDGENKVEELILVLEKQGNTCSVELLGDK